MERPDPLSWSVEQAARWAVLADELRRRLGPGALLPSSERHTFEGALGVDPAHVVVHRGPFAGHLAQVAGGDALSSAGHVLGAAERLAVETPRGAALLGHEVTHAVRSSPVNHHVSQPLQRAGASPPWVDGTDEEIAAQRVEASLLQAAHERPPTPSGSPPTVDAEALTERIYKLLVNQLLLDRERTVGVG